MCFDKLQCLQSVQRKGCRKNAGLSGYSLQGTEGGACEHFRANKPNTGLANANAGETLCLENQLEVCTMGPARPK